MSEIRDDIDWSLTTWESSRRAQLRHALTLTLRERMEAVEGTLEVVWDGSRKSEGRGASGRRPGKHGTTSRASPIRGNRESDSGSRANQKAIPQR